MIVNPLLFQDDGAAFLAFNDVAVDVPVVVTYDQVSNTAVAFDRMVNGQLLTFSVPDPNLQTFVDAETGSTWDMRGIAVAGALAGEQLAQVADSYVGFWLAWSIFFPDVRIVDTLN